MNIKLLAEDKGCRMVFEGRMTCNFAREIEDRIIDTLRRHSHLEVDLSHVTEVDLCGVHLLGVLQSMGGDKVNIAVTSPIVEQAARRLLASPRGASLGRLARKNSDDDDHD